MGKELSLGVRVVALLLLMVLVAAPGHAADYPTKPVTFIVCYPPGGQADVAVRLLAKFATKHLGQPIVVDNKIGAAGQLGADYVARSKPDGYTVGHFFYSQTNAEHFKHFREAVSTSKDFKAVAQWASSAPGIVVRADAQWKSLKDLIDWVKKNPGMTYGQGGKGNLYDVAMVSLAEQVGMNVVDMPTKGDTDSLSQLLGGHLHMGIGSMAAFTPHVKAGKLRALAVLAERRLDDLPNVPTLKELGYNIGFTDVYFAAFVPKDTPEPVVEKLRSAIKKATEDKEFLSSMKKLGQLVIYSDKAEFQKKADDTSAAVIRIFKRLGYYK